MKKIESTRSQEIARIRSLLTRKETVDSSVARLTAMKETITGTGGTNSTSTLLKKLEQKPNLVQEAGLGLFAD